MYKTVEKLKKTVVQTNSCDIRASFAADKKRFLKFKASYEDLTMDYSKCALNEEILILLETLMNEAHVVEKREEMFSGKLINWTERRPALHFALRNRINSPIIINEKDIMPEINAALMAMEEFSESLRSGNLKGAKGHTITDVVNIGIGGSDLGPAMAVLALKPYHCGLNLHFVSNVDGSHITDALKNLVPETTFFIVASKTFTTTETIMNAHVARSFISEKLGENSIKLHFAAISTDIEKVAEFGISNKYTFKFWDWVGGRYSIWSSIGLPLMIAIGANNFFDFLKGAYEIDVNFRTASFRDNLPMLLGLIGYFHRVVLEYPTRAILPYDQRLSRFPAYIQQLDMESNGKSITIEGKSVDSFSGPVIWGEPGTNGQHAFYQLLHQGTDIVPVEFMIAANNHEDTLRHHHDFLIANCLAQSESLIQGRTLEAAKNKLAVKGLDIQFIEKIAPHHVFLGNRPSITFAYSKLTPRTLGRLIALYEHRVFVEGILFRINSFDQWGVELGKEVANELLPIVQGEKNSSHKYTSSTVGLASILYKLSNK
ncbi:Glucose-6-phosphate isomerase [Liberibacter crescens BT-1]|uniref:Glucose-6-phosphate isomerase n=1 Tax=Liberibacter crescens (strain BT-1) TaxID=1215343 RepID=L0EWN4_LIBCB|nr:glucose-6-phosphate isomerase [Liberibacter crescens]AGA65270.1 Glucose-6-phosphate isomerase [Liberibacter crescens BT-1]AMC13206.1 glucose-6-phosphate isomerase [Liberibacter crescens]